MKTILVVRDGKVVEINPDELQESKSNILLKEGSTNERGQRRIFKETAAKSKYYISKK